MNVGTAVGVGASGVAGFALTSTMGGAFKAKTAEDAFGSAAITGIGTGAATVFFRARDIAWKGHMLGNTMALAGLGVGAALAHVAAGVGLLRT